MEIILNITAFCLSVVALMILYIGFEIALGLYEQHKINKMYHKYKRMCEDGSIEFPDDWSKD